MTIEPATTNRAAIISARLRNGWSQSELGRRAGLHSSVISRIESGETFGLPATRLAIANALDLDIDDITEMPQPQNRRAGSRQAA
jgi:transcriptional regulator with XRE-family HTH domain